MYRMYRKATKEAWALASSLCGLKNWRVVLSGCSLDYGHSLLWPICLVDCCFPILRRKIYYTKSVLACQGDLALFVGIASSYFWQTLAISEQFRGVLLAVW